MWYFALGGSGLRKQRDGRQTIYQRTRGGKEAKKQEHETDGNKIGISSLQCAARVTQTPAEERRGGEANSLFLVFNFGCDVGADLEGGAMTGMATDRGVILVWRQMRSRPRPDSMERQCFGVPTS